MHKTISFLVISMLLLLGCALCQNPINDPVKFNKEKTSREARIVERLIDIRNAEVFYKYANGRYTGSFDTLIAFCKNNEVPVVRLMPDPADMTYTQVIYDTIGFIRVIDTIAGNRTGFNIEDLGVVPFSEPRTQFELTAGYIDRGGVLIPVFEAKTPYEVYLSTPPTSFSSKEWNKRVKNAKLEKEENNQYAGLKVGSMEEATTDGNWEKL